MKDGDFYSAEQSVTMGRIPTLRLNLSAKVVTTKTLKEKDITFRRGSGRLLTHERKRTL